MPKRYSSDEIIKALQKRGFVFVSQKGSHMKFRKAGLTVIVPSGRKQMPNGTLASILRQAKLNREDLQD